MRERCSSVSCPNSCDVESPSSATPPPQQISRIAVLRRPPTQLKARVVFFLAAHLQLMFGTAPSGIYQTQIIARIPIIRVAQRCLRQAIRIILALGLVGDA